MQQGYGNVEISAMLNEEVLPNTISAINNGTKHRKKGMEYPIRKETNTLKNQKDKSLQIKKLLEEGILNNK